VCVCVCVCECVCVCARVRAGTRVDKLVGGVRTSPLIKLMNSEKKRSAVLANLYKRIRLNQLNITNELLKE